MFKKIVSTLLLLTSFTLLSACQFENSQVDSQEETVTDLTIAAYLPPMTDIITASDTYIPEPYTVELLEVTDNDAYNEAVEAGTAQANLGQHAGYLTQYNRKNETGLVAVQPIYTAVVGYYSPNFDSIEEITDNSTVAIPNDASNEARALNLLEAKDLITTNSKDPLSTSIENITENPYNFNFEQIDLLDAATAYEEGTDLIFSYPTYINKAGIEPEDALFLEEDPDYTFAIQLVTSEELADSEAIKTLSDTLTSNDMRDFITKIGKGNIQPAF